MQPPQEPSSPTSSAVPSSSAAAPGAGPRQRALDSAVREIERHAAGGGWDGPIRLFALVRTARALREAPELADQLPPAAVAAAALEPEHLTSVEQEDLPQAGDLEALLAGIAWPPSVDGAAVVVERIVLPPAAEADLPDDPQRALERLMAHPERQDVRIAAAVLRDGSSSCAVRTRAVDEDDAVGVGPDLVPGLVAALRATFA